MHRLAVVNTATDKPCRCFACAQDVVAHFGIIPLIRCHKQAPPQAEVGLHGLVLQILCTITPATRGKALVLLYPDAAPAITPATRGKFLVYKSYLLLVTVTPLRGEREHTQGRLLYSRDNPRYAGKSAIRFTVLTFSRDNPRFAG